MPTVCKNNECAGCMACVDICPQKAITIEDKLYAYNAQIDISKCVHCNLCHKVCPNNTQLDFLRLQLNGIKVGHQKIVFEKLDRLEVWHQN